MAAFNVYNLEGVRAVTLAAEREQSPVILRVLPGAAAHGGDGVMAMVWAAAAAASVPVAFHFDHSTDLAEMEAATSLGVSGALVDIKGERPPDRRAFAFLRGCGCG